MKSGNILLFCFRKNMKILMVCLGNICRSPLAEGILQSKLPKGFTVDSAGTISQHEGEFPDHRAMKTAENHGLSLEKQRSRPVKKTDLQNFDKIYCMDLNNYKDVISMAEDENQRKKISLFLEAAGETGENIEVPDPYWGGMDAFEKVYQMLDKAAEQVAKNLIKEKNT